MLIFAIASCGEDSPSDDQARDLAVDYLEAYVSADPDLCDLITSSERAAVELLGTGTSEPRDCEQVIEESGTPLQAADIRRAAAAVRDAPLARQDGYLAIRFVGPQFPNSLTLSLLFAEDEGEWKVDDLQLG